MPKMNLCARCSDLMRERFLVRMVYRDVNAKIDCDNCKRHTYGAIFEVGSPKRRVDNEQT